MQKHYSAESVLPYLYEKERDLQIYALKKLDLIVDHAWHQISDKISKIEALKDEEDFPEKELAASVASKVFYYLEEYEEALKFALEAGSKFNITEDSKYVETLIHKCIDHYIDKRKRQYER